MMTDSNPIKNDDFPITKKVLDITEKRILGEFTTLTLNMNAIGSKTRAETKQDLIEAKLELREEIKELGSELRSEMKELGAELRGEMKTLGSELRSEMKVLETNLRSEMKNIDSSLRNEIKAIDYNLRQEIKSLGDNLRDEISLQGLNLNSKIDNLKVEFSEVKTEVFRLSALFEQQTYQNKVMLDSWMLLYEKQTNHDGRITRLEKTQFG